MNLSIAVIKNKKHIESERELKIAKWNLFKK